MSGNISPEKILIVGPSWVGDMVMTGALVKRLAKRQPVPQIHIVAPPWALGLVERLPFVVKAHALDVPHGTLGLLRRWQLGRLLAAERFSEAIILPRSFKSALVPVFAGIPVRRGLIGEARFGLINAVVPLRPKEGRTVDDFVALAGAGLHPLAPDETPELTTDETQAAMLRMRFGLDPAAPLAVLCPGAEYGPAKRWPATHFSMLAQNLIVAGAVVVLLGSSKDGQEAAQIAAGHDPARLKNLTGATTLAEAIDIIGQADVVVCNDSGLMHVAAALNRKALALFGSSSAERTPPLSASAEVIEIDLGCRPCFKRVCPLKHTNCLVQIPVERVASTATAALRARV